MSDVRLRLGPYVELIGCGALFVLFIRIIGYWFNTSFACFESMQVLPFVACIAGLSWGMFKGGEKLWQLAPMTMAATTIIAAAGVGSGLAQQSLPLLTIESLANGSGAAALQTIWQMIGSVVAILILLSGPFLFSSAVGVRTSEQLKVRAPLPGYIALSVGGAVACCVALILGLAHISSIGLILPLVGMLAALCMSQSKKLVSVIVCGLIAVAAALMTNPVPIASSNLTLITVSQWSAPMASLGKTPQWAVVAIMAIVLVVLFRPTMTAAQASKGGWQLLWLGLAYTLMAQGSVGRLLTLYGMDGLPLLIVSGLPSIILLSGVVIGYKAGAKELQPIFYLGLIISLLVSCLLPMSWLASFNSKGMYLGNVVITFLTLVPIFRGALIFANAFGVTATPGRAFSYYMTGATFAMIIGFIGQALYPSSVLWASLIGYVLAAQSQLSSEGEKEVVPVEQENAKSKTGSKKKLKTRRIT